MRTPSIFLFMALIATPNGVSAADGCPAGTYSAITSPDGTTLSVLFDSFFVSGGGASPVVRQQECDLQIPLNLPAGFSLGVYRVDYRGFAHLSTKEEAALSVDYHLGKRDKSRQFRRKVKGTQDGEFVFTENIGAGLMKRAGCGEEAVLNISIDLTLSAASGSEAMATLDTADGAPKGGLTYYLDTKKC